MPEPTEEPASVRINIPLDKELHKALKVLSAETDTDLKALVPRLLREALVARAGRRE